MDLTGSALSWLGLFAYGGVTAFVGAYVLFLAFVCNRMVQTSSLALGALTILGSGLVALLLAVGLYLVVLIFMRTIPFDHTEYVFSVLLAAVYIMSVWRRSVRAGLFSRPRP